jgi:Tfp pilus assembly protein PilF
MQERTWLLLLVGVGALAYADSFAGPFVFDDTRSINNEVIRHPVESWRAVVSRYRPVVTVTVAANYALGEFDVRGYHVFNLVVHLLAGLTLYSVVRRTLLLPRMLATFGKSASVLAFAVSAIWLVHPLQTESVTYVIQRAESLMGLFCLLTLYCVVRGATAPERRAWWYAAAVLSCALGMGSKEVMVSAPLVVLLYDRIFLAGSVRTLLRERWPLYVGLVATWVILLVPVQIALGIHPDLTGTGGGGVPGLTPWWYLLSQAAVILHYLRLVVWPHPLVLDYGWPAPETLGDVVLPCILVLGLLLATAWALWRRPEIGFLGAAFFLILAPTSSIMPIDDLAFEHRMYLPLAAVVVLAVVAATFALEALTVLFDWRRITRILVAGGTLASVLAVLVVLTLWRNQDYQSRVSIWRTVVTARPDNDRGHYNLAKALVGAGKIAEAGEEFRRTFEIKPDHADAHADLGLALAAGGDWKKAERHYREALRIQPNHPVAHNSLGSLLFKQGKVEEAMAHFEAALQTYPDYATAHFNLAQALVSQGQLEAAILHYEDALRIRPDLLQAPEILRAIRQRLIEKAQQSKEKPR